MSVDHNGYPTEEALAALDAYDGTPEGLTEHLRAMTSDYGRVYTVDHEDHFGTPNKRLTLVTGGWSGCEEVVSRLQSTMFHVAFWESSWRGGKHTYLVPNRLWNAEQFWGKL